MIRTTGTRHAEHVTAIVQDRRRFSAAQDGPELAIINSWERCLNQYQLDPTNRPKPVVLEGAGLKERRERLGDMLDIARTECRNLYEQTASSGYAVVLTDVRGIILDYVCDPTLEDTFNRTGIFLGAIWSEKHEGTNGMGTCVQDMKPIIVHRDDHFYDDLIGLTCTSVPIHDPHGNLQAALDVTSFNSKDTKQSQVHTRALVQMSANCIEYRNFLRCYRNTTVLKFHTRAEFLGIFTEGMLAIDGDGCIIAANEAALRQLCCENREQLVGRAVDEVFNITNYDLEEKSANQLHNIWPMHDVHHRRRYLAIVHGPMETISRKSVNHNRISTVTVSPNQQQACLDLKGLAGNDPHMAYNVRCARRVMNKDVSILLCGETGTGKEAFAKAIHEASKRSSKPFVALNCAAIPESLIESELFGYKHGAFTGARREGMRGSILQSNGGTLFLDEIGDMPFHLQTRLLRVLESKEVLPLGSQTPVQVDLHVISATNRDLGGLIDRSEFREDLYYRLNGITLTLPPLRQRRDLETLIRCVVAAENDTEKVVSIEDAAFKKLLGYHWPGSFRELHNVIRTALALSDDGIIRLADLPKEIADLNHNSKGNRSDKDVIDDSPLNNNACTPLETAERDALLMELERYHWNVTLTAEKLKMSRSTLYRKLKKYDIPVAQTH